MFVSWQFSTKIFDSDDGKYITPHSKKKEKRVFVYKLHE